MGLKAKSHKQKAPLYRGFLNERTLGILTHAAWGVGRSAQGLGSLRVVALCLGVWRRCNRIPVWEGGSAAHSITS